MRFPGGRLLHFWVLIILTGLAITECKKTTANKAALGSVRVNNMQKEALKRLQGPSVTVEKTQELIRLKAEVKRKLERKEAQDAARAIREENKMNVQLALQRKIRSSSMLFRALSTSRQKYEYAGGDEEEEEENGGE